MLISGLACGGDEEALPTSTPISGLITYTDEVNGFSFSYPDDWQIASDELTEDIIDVMVLAPVACGDIPTNLNVASEGLPYPMSVQTYYYEYNEWKLHAYPEYSLISSDELTVAGEVAIRNVFTWSLSGQIPKQMQVYVVQDEKAWVMTFTTAPACWSQYEAVFDTIAASFQLLD
jgi:hypothetical protein